MTILADVQKHAEGIVLTFIDDETPVGHFGATTKIMNNLVTYLLHGEKDNPKATVKGSVILVERHGGLSAIGYTNGSLIGGNYIGEVPNFKTAFAQMI